MQLCTCVGEVSGDRILASIISELRVVKKSIRVSGIAGPEMISQGTYPLFPMEHLSVMGIMEVLPRLHQLISIRQQMKDYIKVARPHALLTCDAPDFNLALCGYSKKLGIPAFHVVSPSVWAWRAERIPEIAKQLDGLLCLFPFEPKLYEGTGLKTKFIGHPLATQIRFNPDPRLAREIFNLPISDPILAILPGSRNSEIKTLLELFLTVFDRLCQRIPNLSAIIPATSNKSLHFVQRYIKSRPIKLVLGQAREVIAASDTVLLASGTAALEACLTGRPAVAVYRLNTATYYWVKRKLISNFVTLPNFIANRALIPELIQSQATVSNIVGALEHPLRCGASKFYLEESKIIHDSLATPLIESASEWLLEQWS